jgi:hypothetical protein
MCTCVRALAQAESKLFGNICVFELAQAELTWLCCMCMRLRRQRASYLETFVRI